MSKSTLEVASNIYTRVRGRYLVSVLEMHNKLYTFCPHNGRLTKNVDESTFNIAYLWS